MITLGLSSIGLPLPVSRLGFTGAGPTVFGLSSTPPSSNDGVSKIVINPPLLVISGLPGPTGGGGFTPPPPPPGPKSMSNGLLSLNPPPGVISGLGLLIKIKPPGLPPPGGPPPILPPEVISGIIGGRLLAPPPPSPPGSLSKPPPPSRVGLVPKSNCDIGSSFICRCKKIRESFDSPILRI